MRESGGVERNDKPQNWSAEEGKRLERDGEYRGGLISPIER